jgi:hypothetical protein
MLSRRIVSQNPERTHSFRLAVRTPCNEFDEK